MNQELTNYVNQSRASGQTDMQIRQALVQQGWSQMQIDEAFGITAPVPVVPVAPAIPIPSTRAQAVSNKNGMAILAYLGFLIVVPFVTDAKNDPFVKFHIKQGLGLVIVWIGVGIVSSMFSYMLYSISGLFFLASFLFPLIYLGLGIINVIGLINAATGKMKPLPVIGGISNMFNF